MSTLFQASARLSWSGADALAPVYTDRGAGKRGAEKRNKTLESANKLPWSFFFDRSLTDVHLISAAHLILKQNQTFHSPCNKIPVLKSVYTVLRLSHKHSLFPDIPLKKYSRYIWYQLMQLAVEWFPSSWVGSRSRSQAGYGSSCRNLHTYTYAHEHTHTGVSSNYTHRPHFNSHTFYVHLLCTPTR